MAKHRSDQLLVEACRRGDGRAWDALIKQYGRLVYSIPRRYGMDDAGCDDIFQTVFATLFRSLDALRDQTRLSAWLITTTHRACWRLRRQHRSAVGVGRVSDESETSRSEVNEARSAATPDAPAVADLIRWEQQHLVRQALEALGGRCERLLILLFQTQGELEYQSIAQTLGMKVGSIGPTRARCFAKLQAILADLGVNDDLD